MAGTVTATDENIGTIRQVTFDWLSDSAGNVSGTTSGEIYNGEILGVLCIPDSGGTAPTDQYDVTLIDADSRDMLFGQGANLSGTLSVAILENLGFVATSTLAPTVANAGDENGGIIVVYVR